MALGTSELVDGQYAIRTGPSIGEQRIRGEGTATTVAAVTGTAGR